MSFRASGGAPVSSPKRSRLSSSFPVPKRAAANAAGRLSTLGGERLSGLLGSFSGNGSSPKSSPSKAPQASSSGPGASASETPPRACGTPLKQVLNKLVIHPNSSFKSFWDLFILFCVLYSSIVTPFLVAFQTYFLGEVDTVLDFIFFFDLLVQGLTGYFILGGSRFPVLQIDRAMKNYARTWFAPDAIAAVPFDAFVPQLRAVALVKTIRLVKVRRILKKYNEMSIGPFLKVFSILFFWVLCAHWMACGFFVIGWSTCGYFHGDGNTTYTNAYGERLPCSVRGSPCEGNWITTYWPIMASTCAAGGSPQDGADAAGLTLGSMYVRSLAWALSTMSSMGYGRSPVAISNTDYAYGFCTQIVGACLAAAIFSNFAQLINKGESGAVRYQEQLQKIVEFSRLYKLSKTAQKTLLDYHELLFSAYRGFDLKQVALMFPKHLQISVFFSLHGEQLRQIPMFKEVEDSFLQELALELGTHVLLQDDFAFRQGDLGDKMFFIQFGQIEIGNADCSVIYLTKATGSYFGEIAVFSNQRRTASARAKSDVIMYTLSKCAFESVAARFPAAYESVYACANAIVMKLRTSNAKADQRASEPGTCSSSSSGGRMGRRRSSSGISAFHTLMGHGQSKDAPRQPRARRPSSDEKIEAVGGPTKGSIFGSLLAQAGGAAPSSAGRPRPSAAPCASLDATRPSVTELMHDDDGGARPSAVRGSAALDEVDEEEDEAAQSSLLPGVLRACRLNSSMRGATAGATPPPSPPSALPPSLRQQAIWGTLRQNLQAVVEKQGEAHATEEVTKRLPIFHSSELSALPPPALASLYSGQALASLHQEVIPLLSDLTRYMAMVARAHEAGAGGEPYSTSGAAQAESAAAAAGGGGGALDASRVSAAYKA